MRGPAQRLFGNMRLPVIAAPMFLVSGPDLVLAACRAGIGAALPAPNARTLEQLDEWLATLRRETAALAQAGENPGPWALNLVTHSSYERLPAEIELMCRHRPPLVITALGSPSVVVDAVHAYGGLVFADVNSVAYARKAVATGVDGLVLVCSGAGGHTGATSPFAFVAEVREFFDGVVALAGSIGNGRAIRAAQVLGADLAYLGTPFIVAEESLASAEYRAMVVEATLDDLVQSAAFTGANAWYLRQSIRRAGLDPDQLTDKAAVDLRDAERKIKVWRDIWSAGQGVGLIHQSEPAAAIVKRLLAEYQGAQ